MKRLDYAIRFLIPTHYAILVLLASLQHQNNGVFSYVFPVSKYHDAPQNCLARPNKMMTKLTASTMTARGLSCLNAIKDKSSSVFSIRQKSQRESQSNDKDPNKNNNQNDNNRRDKIKKIKRKQHPIALRFEDVSPRFIAVQAIRIGSEKKNRENFSTRKLESNKLYHEFEQRNKNFMRLLASTVDRRKGEIDKVISYFQKRKSKSSKSMNRSDLLVQAVLRVGAAQLLFTDIPQHAAVKETIDVLRMDPTTRVSEPQIKFANAILRNIARDGKKIMSEVSTDSENLSPWLYEELKSNWGEEKTNLMTKIFLQESPVINLSTNFRYSSLKDDDNEDHHDNKRYQKLSQLHEIVRVFDEASSIAKSDKDSNDHQVLRIVPNGSIQVRKRYFPGPLSGWPLYNTGQWFVQDISATIPAIALKSSLSKQRPIHYNNKDLLEQQKQPNEKEGKIDGDDEDKIDSSLRILDLCAAPGGKTMQLLSLGFDSVTAVDASKKRMKLLKSNLKRMSLRNYCNVVTADATEWVPTADDESDSNKEDLLFDGILVDVPCTATGTALKNPDVLRKISSTNNVDDNNLNELLQVQGKVASHCAGNLLSVGGIMIYSTCSILKKESEDQVHQLLCTFGALNDDNLDGINLKSVPFQPGEIPGFDDAIDENGWLRILPGVLPNDELKYCDGFFVARLQRVR